MSAPILAILAALVPFVIWLWKRRAARKDDPKRQTEKRVESIHHEIATHNETGANLRVDSLLTRARLHKAESDKRRQNHPPS